MICGECSLADLVSRPRVEWVSCGKASESADEQDQGCLFLYILPCGRLQYQTHLSVLALVDEVNAAMTDGPAGHVSFNFTVRFNFDS